jgi:signal transduction histidine kinase
VTRILQAVQHEAPTTHPVELVTVDPVYANVDAAQVERIVENLVTNAIRYTPAGTGIWLSAESATGGVLLSIDDAGPGIPAEIRESIFEPFRQGNEVIAHSPGVGIGLSLVARFAELHGGRAWVEDREGGGAAFRVFLPFETSDAPAGLGEPTVNASSA